jgi:hypothetical protein
MEADLKSVKIAIEEKLLTGGSLRGGAISIIRTFRVNQFYILG